LSLSIKSKAQKTEKQRKTKKQGKVKEKLFGVVKLIKKKSNKFFF
jgi:hypothetical protein